MIADVRRTLESGARPASLCWFGDHVPIMPAVYARCGLPSGEVDYVLNGVTPKPGYVAYTYPHPLRTSGAPAFAVCLPMIER